MIGTSRSVTANINRLNSYMDRNGLAAVAVRTGVNFTYLAGMAPCAKNPLFSIHSRTGNQSAVNAIGLNLY